MQKNTRSYRGLSGDFSAVGLIIGKLDAAEVTTASGFMHGDSAGSEVETHACGNAFNFVEVGVTNTQRQTW